jgi:N-methylhydantoinase A
MRVGVDIGGTFTDFVGMDENGKIIITKFSTTPKELTEGVQKCFDKAGLHKLSEIEQILHGSTVAINTIIQRVGAKTALITTRGFRDSYEIGRCNRPDSWNLFFHRPRPLVPREWRLEVTERITAKGDVVVPLNEPELAEIVTLLKKENIEAVAVCFLHSYQNPVHEQRVGEILRRELPGVFITLSHELIREMREYERTSTTVLNAYIGPIVTNYLDHLDKRMQSLEFQGALLIMQSNGGCMSAEVAKQQPILTAESGTASGVIGACYLAQALDLSEAIAFDMGGTTAKTALIHNKTVPTAQGLYIGGYNTGQPILGPVVDINEIGAGGGSIAWVDEFGALSVGPKSAGADPGPVCYGQGGAEPTVTDANLILGRLNPKNFLGGQMPLMEELARSAMKSRIADPKAMEVYEAADTVLQIVINNMSLAVRKISVERGIDPRECSIIAFGGAGPLHAAAVAKELLIPKVIVPQMPGNFSAVGMLVADLRHDYVQTYLHDLKSANMREMVNILQQLERQGKAILLTEGAHPNTLSHSIRLGLRYQGQDHVLSVPVTFEELEAGNHRDFIGRYDRIHQEIYGHAAPGEEVEVVNLRLSVSGLSQKVRPAIFQPIAEQRRKPEVSSRQVYWGSDQGWQKTSIYQREQLGIGLKIGGPAIVEEFASTTSIPPGSKLTIDKLGNLILEVV